MAIPRRRADDSAERRRCRRALWRSVESGLQCRRGLQNSIHSILQLRQIGSRFCLKYDTSSERPDKRKQSNGIRCPTSRA